MGTSQKSESAGYALAEGWAEVPPELAYGDATGVAVGRNDSVVVLTRHPSRLLAFTADGAFVLSWGDGLFTERVHGLTIGPDGTFFIVDDGDHTVRKFSRDGELLMTLGISGRPSETGYDGKNVGSTRFGGDPFNRPTNVALGPAGELFVTDGYGNARVHRFSAEGEMIGSWGQPGSGPCEFRLPHGIMVLPDERLLVADRENDRIQVFAPDGMFVEEWTNVQRPTQMAYDSLRGVIAVSELGWRAGQRSFVHGVRDHLPSRVSILDTKGAVLDRWGGPDSEAPGNFVAAHAVAFDRSGNLYVAEVSWTIGVSQGLAQPGCHNLQKFTPR